MRSAERGGAAAASRAGAHRGHAGRRRAGRRDERRRRSSCPSGTAVSGLGRVVLFTARRGEPAGGRPARPTPRSARRPAPTSSYVGRCCRWPAPACSASTAPSTTTRCRRCASAGVTLATAASLDEVRDTIATTQTLFWVVGPALVALVAGLAWLLAGRALRPVHAVTSRVAAIGSHSLHERVPVPASSDEIAELATTMNDMLGRLEAASATNRRLVSDASTSCARPVAVMRTELEVAGRDADTDWEATSAVLLGELDRLQGMSTTSCSSPAATSGRSPATDVDSPTWCTRSPPGAGRCRWPSTSATSRSLASATRTRCGGPLDHLVANAARHAATSVAVASIDVHDGEVASTSTTTGRASPSATDARRRASLRAPRRGAGAGRWRRRARAGRHRPTSRPPTAGGSRSATRRSAGPGSA